MNLRVRMKHVDINMHMNYAAYFELMELGRWDWCAQSGVLLDWARQRLRPIVGSLDMKYSRELKPGTSFTLETSLTGFDRRAAVFEQRFMVGPHEHAAGRVNALLVGPHGVLKAEELAATLPETLRPAMSS